MVIFPDAAPASKFHMLVVPKKHIKNINTLKKDDLELLRHMK